MIFDAEPKARLSRFFVRCRKRGLLLNVALLLAITFHSQIVHAEKIKLAVFPVNDTMDLKKHQSDYLYDVIREAASASAGSYIALIHEQKIKGAVKKNRGTCDEDCALKAATQMNARVALVVEMHQHGAQILGVVKLLDTQENVLLTVKRFFSDTLQGAEQELQGAVMFVLSAQFLPIEDSDRRALQIEQQNIPVNYARPNQNESPLQTSPSTPVTPPAETQNTDQGAPEYSYSNTDIAQPSAPTNPKVYLITSIIMGTIGVGFTTAGIIFGVKAYKEQGKWEDEKFKRDTLLFDYENVGQSGGMTEQQFDLVYSQVYPDSNISYSNYAEVVRILDVHSENLTIINDTIRLNGIMAGVFGGLAIPSLIISGVFAAKYVKSRKSGTAAHQLNISPVLSKEMSGAMFSATF
ncbi:MAG: hypothetical protein JXX29_10870 [Deltaproteobacteria bacterium]|nr:hypothetical protein [Deltaproteobacteria bacterium]MBN2672171.1 hypothetical protein [Deltaproteobacteria bacterium]